MLKESRLGISARSIYISVYQYSSHKIAGAHEPTVLDGNKAYYDLLGCRASFQANALSNKEEG